MENFRNWKLLIISSFESWRGRISENTIQFQDKTKIVNRSSVKPMCWIWTKYDMSKLIKPGGRKTEEPDEIFPSIKTLSLVLNVSVWFFWKIKNNSGTCALVNWSFFTLLKIRSESSFVSELFPFFTLGRSLPCFKI